MNNEQENPRAFLPTQKRDQLFNNQQGNNILPPNNNENQTQNQIPEYLI